jgi:hypothetical protein
MVILTLYRFPHPRGKLETADDLTETMGQEKIGENWNTSIIPRRRSAAMTEKEWLECSEQAEVLEFLHGRVSDRKLRLYAIACVRTAWTYLSDEAVREAAILLEKLVDSKADEADRAALYDDLRSHGESTAQDLLDRDARFAFEAGESVLGSDEHNHTEEAWSLRNDIFGNPFRRVNIDPSWKSTEVTTLAQVIYDERAFHLLPNLLEALEEAGCTNKEILAHCRGPGPHVKGCWVVDAILGKE